MDTTVKIKDIDFVIYKWNLRTIMRNQNIVVPLVRDPIINALSMASSEDEDTVILSVVDGVLSSLAGIDMEKLAERLIQGGETSSVYYRNDKGVQETVSIDTLEKLGFGLTEVISLCMAIIKYNYGDALKKDLLASLMETATL